MWKLMFAWLPVQVDAYHEDEIRDGKMRYYVWLRYVERMEDTWIDEDGSIINRVRHRLKRP